MARTRNDSVDGKRKIHESATTKLEPVSKLSVSALKYFDRYAQCRMIDDWSAGDVVRLERLCGWMVEIDDIKAALDSDGMVILNQRGTPIPNPLLTARDNLERLAMAAEAKLHVYSPALDGSGHKRSHDKVKEVNKARDAASKNEHLNLLA
jgi:hypothetical protein